MFRLLFALCHFHTHCMITSSSDLSLSTKRNSWIPFEAEVISRSFCCMAMDSSTAQSLHQEVGPQTLESMLGSTKPQQEKKPRPAEQSLKCPRCDSTNTKFCYYNNYSLSQPRYFCKSCRRYWTKGGTLRNVPVGGGCRKTKRSSSSSSSRRYPITTPAIPSYTYDSNLAIPPGRLGLDDPSFPVPGNPCMSLGDCGLIDALRSGTFLEFPRGLQNLYGGNGLEYGAGLGMGGLNEEMGFEELSSGGRVKQEICNGDGTWWENGELDTHTRIGFCSSTWHGLLNTPLM